jgi:biotin-(acetyl-CoA carboxylase) ligase
MGDAFLHASSRAGELGAGTLVVVGRFDLVEFAVVLEPDEPLASARRVFIAGMTALADALASLAPPRRPIAIEWPGALFVDGGLVGGGRLAWPDKAPESVVPDWLVFGAMIRAASMAGEEGGAHPSATALEDEGFDMTGSDRLVGSFARPFMGAIDRLQAAGFASVAADYAAKLHADREATVELDKYGDLLIRKPGRRAKRHELRRALGTVAWLDPESGAPRS